MAVLEEARRVKRLDVKPQPVPRLFERAEQRQAVCRFEREVRGKAACAEGQHRDRVEEPETVGLLVLGKAVEWLGLVLELEGVGELPEMGVPVWVVDEGVLEAVSFLDLGEPVVEDLRGADGGRQPTTKAIL